MTKEQSGGQKATNAALQTIEIEDAVRIVNATIEGRRRRLQAVANGENHLPIEITGETETDYPAVVEVDPAKVCKLLLDFDEPIYRALDMEYPTELWKELANLSGLHIVDSIDVDVDFLDD